MKAIAIIAIISAIAASAYGKVQNKGLITWYDCTGKANGNYDHPSECTKFISCSNGYSYEMECGDCHTSEGPERCPDGRLHYHKATDKCEFANVAQCSIGTGATEVPTTEYPTTDVPVETTTGGHSGDACNPKDCKLEGHCTAYRKCNKSTSRWENLTCSDGLFWNPEWNAAEIGGSCDKWENLSEAVKNAYEKHDQCFPDCYFKEDAECSSSYIFHPAGTDHRTLESLYCPSGLLWNQGHETCDLCGNVLVNATVSLTDYCKCP